MAIVLDLIIIAIIAIAVIKGAKSGLISAVFDFCKFIVAVIAAFVFKDRVSGFIMNTEIFSGARTRVTEALTTAISNAGENISSEDMLAAFEKENAGLVKLIEAFGGSLENTREWIQNMTGENGNIAELAAQYIIEPAANVCSQVLAFIAVFVIAFIALVLLQKLLNLIFKLPVLKQLNKTGGILIGIVCAFLYVSLFCAVISPLLSNSELFGMDLPKDLTGNTVLFAFFSENNLFTYLGMLFSTGTQNTIL